MRRRAEKQVVSAERRRLFPLPTPAGPLSVEPNQVSARIIQPRKCSNAYRHGYVHKSGEWACWGLCCDGQARSVGCSLAVLFGRRPPHPACLQRSADGGVVRQAGGGETRTACSVLS